MKQTTLCFPVIGDPISSVLLGFKKRGFGAGKYTGFGGKIELDETPAEAAARELQEEACLSVDANVLTPAGILSFFFPHRPSWSQQVHLFLMRSWTGNPAESDEMRPAWFGVDAIPYEQMWEDARHWLPCLLAGQAIQAKFTFAADNQSVAALE